MLRTLRRIVNDIGNRRNLESYATSLAVMAFAIFSFFFDTVPQNVQFAALLAGIALLVFKTTEPPEIESLDVEDVLKDRQSYGKLGDFIHNANTLWVYGASGVNVLRNIEDIKREVLDRGGSVRVLMQDPLHEESINILYQQLDKMHDLRRDIENSQDIIKRIQEKNPRGKVEYGFVPYSPGFSLLIVDADGKDGRLVVEFYGYQNEVITERMHIELHRHQSAHWFEYWAKQFEVMWENARKA